MNKEEIDKIRKKYKITKDNFIDEKYASIRFDISFFKDFEILLNYIDELQKDLENLKEVEREICCEELITKDKYQDILKENADLKMQLEIEKIDNKYNKEETGEEMIPRYKIREYITRLEQSENLGISDIYESMKDFAIEVLEELLGE